MHQTPVSILSPSECQSNVNGYNSESSLCGKTQDDACQCDIGSALACSNGNGKYTLRGVYATENQCGAGSNQIVTFTKMDVQWIRAAMQSPGRSDYVSESNSPVGYKTSLPSKQAPAYLPPRL